MNVLVTNPHSGDAKDTEFWLEHLRDSGIDANPADATDDREMSMLTKNDRLFVAGGDGTMRLHAATCLKAGCTLGVLPSGTGNDFARGINIPLEPKAACRNLAEGKTRDIDVGFVNDEIFLNVAHIGLGTEISRSIDSTHKQWWGRFAYARALFDRLRRMRGYKASIRCDDEMIQGRWLQITVANGRSFGGGQRVFDATPFDGELDLLAIRPRPFYELLSVWFFAHLKGAVPNSEAVMQCRGKAFEIQEGARLEVTADGEPLTHLPVRFSIKPGALRVVVPNSATEGV